MAGWTLFTGNGEAIFKTTGRHFLKFLLYKSVEKICPRWICSLVLWSSYFVYTIKIQHILADIFVVFFPPLMTTVNLYLFPLGTKKFYQITLNFVNSLR